MSRHDWFISLAPFDGFDPESSRVTMYVAVPDGRKRVVATDIDLTLAAPVTTAAYDNFVGLDANEVVETLRTYFDSRVTA